MPTLILNQDLKTLFQGVGVVAVSGLLMGAVMHPNLRGPDDMGGPQILTPASGARSGAYAGDPGTSVYAGRTPEYVIGTDWTRPPAELPMAAEAEDTGDVVVFSDDAPEPAQVTRAAWRDEPPPPPHYPSVAGNRYDRDPISSPSPPADEGDAG